MLNTYLHVYTFTKSCMRVKVVLKFKSSPNLLRRRRVVAHYATDVEIFSYFNRNINKILPQICAKTANKTTHSTTPISITSNTPKVSLIYTCFYITLMG